jgi:hypothetical protein
MVITLYQERAVFGKMKMDPAKRAQTQNAGEVSSLQWFFSQSIEIMTDKVWLHCIRPMFSYLAGMSPYISLKIKKRHYEYHMIETHIQLST